MDHRSLSTPTIFSTRDRLKGALRAPWAARHLTAHLHDGTPLEEEIDVRRWLTIGSSAGSGEE